MRIKYTDALAIIKHAQESFGMDSRIYLFGSRLDDAKRGGDIDLYIIPEHQNDLYKRKITMLSNLKKEIGEQKIDLVISKDQSRLIEKVALNEGIELKYSKLRLEKILNECDKHLLRMNKAHGDMSLFIPLTSETYTKLSEDEIQDIDQYLYRFSKLQDAMGQKLFKAIVSLYDYQVDPLPMIDVINRIEKLGIIYSAGDWDSLRETRNALAHEYDDEPEQMASLINDIYSKKELIETIYLHAKQDVASKL